jgi:hypothetical protein
MSSSAPGWICGRLFGLHCSGSEGSKEVEGLYEEAMAESGGELEFEFAFELELE